MSLRTKIRELRLRDRLSQEELDQRVGVRRETIGHLAHTRTLIIISHRMSSVRGADCIYVLKDGRVAQQGDHETLMAQDGLYHDLVIRQQAMEVAE